jgi:hypothetical protein
LNNDTKLICTRVNKIYRNIIGDVKWRIGNNVYLTSIIVKESRISLEGRERINMICGFYGSERLYMYLTKRTLRTQFGTILKYICIGCQVELLLKILDDIQIEDYMTQQYFDCACIGGDTDIIDMFIDEENTKINIDHGLESVCCNRNVNINVINYLISKGADVNFGLYSACRTGEFDTAKYLISIGADDFDYGLSIACRHGCDEIIKLMIENGAEECSCGMPLELH